MDKEEIKAELEGQDYKTEWNRHIQIRNAFLDCLLFCNLDYFRDQLTSEKNFFSRVIDDFIQSIVAISMLAKEGIMNQCRREYRYLIELAIKACYVSQKNSTSKYEDQLIVFGKILKEDSISFVNELSLTLFADKNLSDEFKISIRRIYGDLSTYTHVTPKQLSEKIILAKKGRYIGFEGTEELRILNDELEKILSGIIVLLFHSIPEWIVGDYLVESDGTTRGFHFNKSKFVNDIDRRFDYKHERQAILELLEKERKAREKF